MDALTNAVVSLCFCAVAVGIIEMLVPDSTFKNQMRLITGAVLIITMLTPFTGELDFSIESFGQTSTVDVSEAAERSVALAANQEIEEILQNRSLGYQKITITTDKDENGSIIISGASIVFDEKDKRRASSAVNEIKEKLGIKVNAGENT